MDGIADKVGSVARRYRVSKVYLYGSYARGDADEDSDTDLCIERRRIRDFFELGNFETDSEDILGKYVDITIAGESKEFIDSIKDEMVPIYVG